jgi:hypothetical protein
VPIVHIASLWSLRGYPSAEAPWSIEKQLDAIKAAGFDGVTGRIDLETGQAARDRNLEVVGYMSSGADNEFSELLEVQKAAGAHHVNVQLADHDTELAEALHLTCRLFEIARKIGELEISVEVHRDTCTETPEKSYALADAYQKASGTLLPITWDFSHFAVVKHLTPTDFIPRLLVRPDLIARSNQFHLRPFNGHHCQVPVTRLDGELSRELKEWLPFAKAACEMWITGQTDPDRTLFVVPEMGPVSSGYGLEQHPSPWEDAVRLRELLAAELPFK